MHRILGVLPVLLLTLLTATLAPADEGMWPYNHLPLDQLRKTYGFEAGAAFFKNLQLASVRFNNGGSGSFVSARGLAMTNHHVASDCIKKLSSETKDYIKDGFYAARQSAELRCPDLELNVLLKIETVTGRVNENVKPEMNEKERLDAQKASTADIEKDCRDSTLNRCDVVNLYSGEIFDLYQYKRYTDVRLVFAPEFLAAFFGGDKDNFTYPRYCLDVSFLRVYENDRPIEPAAYLPWSGDGAQEGDLVFVSGHPGRTERLLTKAQLLFERDRRIPFTLDFLNTMIDAVRAYGRAGGEAERLARSELFGLENALKAYSQRGPGLRRAALIDAKTEAEQHLQSLVENDPEKKKEFGGAWTAIAKAQRTKAEVYEEFTLLERYGFYSRLFTIARDLYRLSAELPKPNNERLPEYRDSGLESLYQRLYSPAPIYDDLEIVKLGASMRFMRDRLGFDHPVIEKVLGERNPDIVARHLVRSTKLKDVDLRKDLASSGNALRAATSDDPLIRLVAAIDEHARTVRQRFEDEVEAVESAHGTRIARARFAAQGSAVYPDATFTLRLAYGSVKGYVDGGQHISPLTSMAGLFEKMSGEDPYILPKRFTQRKGQLKLDTPYNLVSTNDITGGNSGSPLINRAGEIVGIIFDGNIHSLVNDFQYSETQSRAVSVDSRGIMEALQKIYQAQRVVTELKSRP